jgi:hypothetical protein
MFFALGRFLLSGRQTSPRLAESSGSLDYQLQQLPGCAEGRRRDRMIALKTHKINFLAGFDQHVSQGFGSCERQNGIPQPVRLDD